jgi:predicted nucleic acid-binding protein
MGMSRIFFDTNLFIYLLEDKGKLGSKVQSVVERMEERGDDLITSTLTLGEVLVKPISAGDTAWADQYEQLLFSPNVTVVPFDSGAARAYARVRVDKTLKGPDSIQLACASAARCDLFITNDDRLSRKIIPGIQFIASLDRALLYL